LRIVVQMIFFKVGTFYELYEEDAAIAYEVLGYKVTVAGVGRCRCATTSDPVPW
jgi:DNA mismatch repair ATPase MutS